MSVDRDLLPAHAAAEPELGIRAHHAELTAAADPAALLARVAHDRADPRLAITLARTAGNRHVQRVATRRLARAPDPEDGVWLDPLTDPAYAATLPLLRRSPWGREALEAMTKHKVKTLLKRDGPPANFAPKYNRVRLNTTLRDDVVSAYYVHEMYHASQFHEGKSPPALKHDDQGKWVKIMVDEEIEGTARGFLHKLQLERTSPRAKADDNPAWMGFFRGAFDAGYRDAIAAGKDLETARAAGRARGRRMTEALIRPGKGEMHRLGPGEWVSYGEFYAHEWTAEWKRKKAADEQADDKQAVPAGH